MYILELLILLPLFSTFLVSMLSENNNSYTIKLVSLISSCFIFLCSLGLIIFFDNLVILFQYSFFLTGIFSNNIYFGVDGISLFFITLVTFITLLCILIACRRKIGVKFLLIYIFLIEFFCLIIFTVLDILFFYIFFESVLMPMFAIIGIWGSSYIGRVKASFYLFLYTLAGSILLLLTIMLIYLETGTTDLLVLLNTDFSNKKQSFLWLCAFFGFAVKIPLFPIHIWLPEAHVEAPTEGSVILASILLKLGGYGFLRISLSLFPYGSIYFLPLVYTLSVLGIIYASLTTLVQEDLKKIIAYSSVAHMNLVVLGIFSLNVQGIEGSVFLMLGHGIVSGALFFLVGAIYDRYLSREILYYGGLTQVMPLFSFYFLFFTLANMSFPGTCNFVGELLILVGLFQVNPILTFFAASGVVLSAAYSIWLFNRLCFCNLKTLYIREFKEISKKESYLFSYLTFLTLVLGIYPNLVLDSLYFSIKALNNN